MRLIKNNLSKAEKRLGRDLKCLGHVEHLERIQQLESIQHLTNNRTDIKARLDIQNKSFDEVEITHPPDETIIYLDPPYKNVAHYRCKVDYDKLADYILSSPYKIYISEYNLAIPNVECVLEIETRTAFSSINNNKRVVERLYCNRP